MRCALLVPAVLLLVSGAPAIAAEQRCDPGKPARACDGSAQVAGEGGISVARPVVSGGGRDFGSGTIGTAGIANVHATRAFAGTMLQAGGVSIHDVIVDQAVGLVAPFKGMPLKLDDVTIQRVEAGILKRGIHIRGDSARWTISDVRFSYIGPASVPGKIPVGIQIDGTAHDILIERVEMAGFTNTEPPHYPNADGISCERGNDHITVRLSYLHDNKDGGFDCKATNVVVDRVTAARNGRNFRFWGTGTATLLTSIDPRAAHIWLGKGANYTVDRLVARGGGILVDAGDPGATLVVKSCDLSGYTGKQLVAGGATVTFGPGCKL